MLYEEPGTYSEPCQRSTMNHFVKTTATIIYPNYNYCRNISFSRSELYERSTMVFFNTGLVFNLKVFSLMQKSMGPRGPRFGGCEL